MALTNAERQKNWRDRQRAARKLRRKPSAQPALPDGELYLSGSDQAIVTVPGDLEAAHAILVRLSQLSHSDEMRAWCALTQEQRDQVKALDRHLRGRRTRP
jgi:hypothetical protein